MSFLIQESSLEGGSPVELYEIAIGATTFYMTSGEEELTFDTNIYDPIAVKRSQIAVGQDERTSIVNFTLPANHPFVQKYVDTVPGARAVMSIYRFHRTDGLLERVLFFKGVVRSVAFSRQAQEAQLAVMPLTGSLARNFPRFTYQGICNHVLFDVRCKADAGSFQYDGLASAASGNNLTIDGLNAQGAGWAIGGFVQDLLSTDFRLIVGQSGDVISLLLPFPADLGVVGSTMSVFAGCDHTIETCKTKFDNVINYGGFQYVPQKNIFVTGIS